jgi:hypothetical protein
MAKKLDFSKKAKAGAKKKRCSATAFNFGANAGGKKCKGGTGGGS